MLSKEEQREKNKQFWDAFNAYTKRTKSSNGRRINWINYPTDVSFIFVRLAADSKHAALHFDIQPKDVGIREIIWEQMNELKVVLESEMQHPTEWLEEVHLTDGRMISRISWQLSPVNYFNPEDQDRIFHFLKTRLEEFDRFYQEFKDILINLAH